MSIPTDEERGIIHRSLPRNADPLEKSSIRLIVFIEGHASPLWRTAQSREEAKRQNQILSEKRSMSVKKAIVQIAKKEFQKEGNIEFEFDVQYKDPHESYAPIIIGSDSKGDQESIYRAKGDIDANNQLYRRVDVRIRISEDIVVDAGQSVRTIKPSKTKLWYLAIENITSGGYGVGVAQAYFLLKNDWLPRTVQASATLRTMTFANLGSGGAAQRGQELWKSLRPSKPLDWDDFKNTTVTIKTLGITVVPAMLAKDETYVSLPRLGLNGLDFSGWATSASSPGPEAWAGKGKLDFDIPSPTYRTLFMSDPTQTIETEDRYYPVYFETGKSILTASEKRDLGDFVKQVAIDFRKRRQSFLER